MNITRKQFVTTQYGHTLRNVCNYHRMCGEALLVVMDPSPAVINKEIRIMTTVSAS
jgi:hypothetical protein